MPDPYRTNAKRDELARAWQTRRRDLHMFWGVPLFIVPALLLIGSPLGLAWASTRPGLVIGLVCLGIWGVAAVRLASFRCPRCGNRFAQGKVRWTDTCAACGIRVGARRTP